MSDEKGSQWANAQVLWSSVIKIRQLAVAATSLEPLRSQLMALFEVAEDYADPGVAEFGLENSVMALGDSFFEIVAPIVPNTAVERSLSKRQTDCSGYMVLFQLDDFEVFERKVEALGLRQVWRAQRAEVTACHIHPKDIGGAIVSFDEMRPREEWIWAGPNWRGRASSSIAGVKGLRFAATDAAELGQRWATITGHDLESTHGSYRLAFEEGTQAIFDESDEDAVTRFEFACKDSVAVLARAREIGFTVADGCVKVGELQLEFS